MAWWSSAGHEEPEGQTQAIDWGSLIFRLGAADIEDFDFSEVANPLTNASTPTDVKERLIDDAVSVQLQKLEELRKKFVAHSKASKPQPGLPLREPEATTQNLDVSIVDATKATEKKDETKLRRRVKRRKREEGNDEDGKKEKRKKKKGSKTAKNDEREQNEVAVFVPDDDEIEMSRENDFPKAATTVAKTSKDLSPPAPVPASIPSSPFDVGSLSVREVKAPRPQVVPIASPARSMTTPNPSSIHDSLAVIPKGLALSSSEAVRPTSWGGLPQCRRGPLCHFLAWGVCQYYHPPEHMPHAGFDTTLAGSDRRWNVWVNSSRN